MGGGGENINFCLHAVAVIGFNQTLYEVREDAGQAVVYVVLRNGILRRHVVVDVSTVDDSALSECSCISSHGAFSVSFAHRW